MSKLLLPVNLQLFAEEKPESVIENNTVEEPVNKPEVKTITMTQEELDALIIREKGRVKNKFSDYDDLKAKIADYETKAQEAERAKMSEIERLQADLKAKEEAEQVLAKQLEEIKTFAQREKVRNSFITKAQAAGIAYVDDAYQLSNSLLSAVKIDEEGVHGIDEIIAELITNKPFLLAQAKKLQKPIGEPSNGTPNEELKTLEAQLEEAKKAKNFAKVVELSNLIASKK